MATAAAATAAAAGRRLSSLVRCSPSGVLQVGPAPPAAGRRFSTLVRCSPSGVLQVRVPQVVARPLSTQAAPKECDEVVKRAVPVFTEEEKGVIAKLVSESPELLKLKLQVKYYKATAWMVSGVIVTVFLSIHGWSNEASQQRMEVDDLKSKLKNGHEECHSCIHHHHHHIHPTPTTAYRAEAGKD